MTSFDTQVDLGEFSETAVITARHRTEIHVKCPCIIDKNPHTLTNWLISHSFECDRQKVYPMLPTPTVAKTAVPKLTRPIKKSSRKCTAYKQPLPDMA